MKIAEAINRSVFMKILDSNNAEPVPGEIEAITQHLQLVEDSRDYSPNLYEIALNENHKLGKKLSSFTFENYQTNSIELEKIKISCQEYLNSDKSNLVLCGKVGTGKTHLAISIMKTLPRLPHGTSPISTFCGVCQIRFYRKANCLFLPFNRFQDELEDARQKGCKDFLMSRFLANDMVCLDDLRLEDTTSSNRKNIFTLINGLYENNKKIIITTNCTFREIENYDQRIADRLKENGKVLAFPFDSFRGFEMKTK